MTDDEIDAAILREMPEYAKIFPPAVIRAIYRAGMLRAAEIALEHLYSVDAIYAIERAAGGEG